MYVVRDVAAGAAFWHVIGVFDSQERAVQASVGRPYLVDALPMNVALPAELLVFMTRLQEMDQ